MARIVRGKTKGNPMNTQEFIQQVITELESEHENSELIQWVDEILTKICDIAVHETNKLFEETIDQKDAEIKRLEYMLGDKGEHPQLRAYIDAEIHRRYTETFKSPNHESIPKDEIEQLVKEVVDEFNQNPQKYERNLYKQVDNLVERNKNLISTLEFVKDYFEVNDLDKVTPRTYDVVIKALNTGEPG